MRLNGAPGNRRTVPTAFNVMNTTRGGEAESVLRRPATPGSLLVGGRSSISVAAAASALFTLLVVTSAVEFAYRKPELHVALETAAALISLLTAQLLYGRFRQTLERRDLLLTAALSTFAASNLLFSAVPAIAATRPGSFATWAPVGGQLLAATLLAAAALAPARALRHPVDDARRVLGACALAIAAIALAAAVAGGMLPRAIPADLSPASPSRPRVVGNATILAAQFAMMVIMALAAIGFTRRARRRSDELTRWLAVAATFGAFARLNYFIFPSLYSEYFYAGDILRFCFVLALFGGGVSELRRTRHLLATAAAQEERQRMARDVHDGVAQDLAYIVQQGRRLIREPSAPAGLQPLVAAAQRSLDESRHVVGALARPGDEPLAEALASTARETVGREGGRIDLQVEDGVTAAAPTQEALMRVVRESIINARRHGRAATIVVELTAEPHLRLTVTDDGDGFDVDAASPAPGHFGLKSMDARVRAVGGVLTIDSEPGRGTRVEVAFP
jgi:signal transduction histidine kinase